MINSINKILRKKSSRHRSMSLFTKLFDLRSPIITKINYINKQYTVNFEYEKGGQRIPRQTSRYARKRKATQLIVKSIDSDETLEYKVD